MKMEIEHFSHEHPLILKEVQEDESERVICYGCEKPISDSMYSCDECDYFLHKRCAELPREVEEPVHAEHLLTLNASSPNKSSHSICDLCREHLSQFSYGCRYCNFDICISCFSEERTITCTNHQHPMAVISRPALFSCNACGTEDKDTSYMCHTCHFWMHKTCSLSPSTIFHNDHQHPLTLEKQHFKLSNFAQYCQFCYKAIAPSVWAYCCVPCRYFTHVKCATSNSEIERSDEADELLNYDLQTTDYLLTTNYLPTTDFFVDVITKYLEQLNLAERERETEVTYFSHEHPLTLSDVHGNNEIKDEKLLCNGCVQPISSPFYSCSQCNYFLHLSCTNLPTELQHPSHLEHPLYLSAYNKIYDSFQCNLCEAYNNGFCYACKTCEFFIDIKCACLAASYIHEAHKHTVVQSESSESGNCNACGDTFSRIRFGCDARNFCICSRCVLLPRTISHRWDKHPFILSYPPFFDHPNEFHCEICEEEINPNFWIYHCRYCDKSFHLRCIDDPIYNIKFGGIVQAKDHQHPLTFVEKENHKFICCKCGDSSFEYNRVLECLECNYTICTPCCN